MLGNVDVVGGSRKGLKRRRRRGNLEAVEDSRKVEVAAVRNSHQEVAGHIEVVKDRMDSSVEMWCESYSSVFLGSRFLLVLIKDIGACT
jgi:hypothetical protein